MGVTDGARARSVSGPDLPVEGERPRRRGRWALLIGPGLMVMLADTDAGSIITAAQSGASWGYRLVVCQLLLVPVLYVVQETTVRLGIVTGEGHGALIRQHFGRGWALLSALTLVAACVGALISEFAGIAGVGSLVGLPRPVSVGVTAAGLVTLLVASRYQRVERVGIAVGSLEVLFVPAAVLARPRIGELAAGLAHPLVWQQSYLVLLAANVGAVIMPWMVFYQQEAVIDKGLRQLPTRVALRAARVDTAVGSLLTQLIMAAVLITTAATVGRAHPGVPLGTVGDIADALTPFLGRTAAVALFGLGLVGAGVVAALVVTCAGAWGLAEVLGWRHSLNESPRGARAFYAVAAGGLCAGALAVLVAPSLVDLAVDVEVMNACLLPVVLGFLLALERRALPHHLRARGAHRAVTYLLTGVVIGLGLYVAATILLA